MDDVQRQLAAIGKGMVQVNLRLSRVVELVEAGTGPRGFDGPSLAMLLDLVEAVDRTLAAAAAPPPPRSWWARRLAPLPPPVDLEGLALARAHVLAQLALAGIEPVGTSGPVDPRVHQVVEVLSTADSALDGTLARTHRTGWVRASSPPHPIRFAQVTAWRRVESP